MADLARSDLTGPCARRASAFAPHSAPRGNTDYRKNFGFGNLAPTARQKIRDV